jgi:mRNA interferase RelE/StbE
MTAYQIELSPPAMKDLRRITDRRLHDRMTDAIATLAANPRPAGCKKLVGEVDQWRIRVGDWRVTYRGIAFGIWPDPRGLAVFGVMESWVGNRLLGARSPHGHLSRRLR